MNSTESGTFKRGGFALNKKGMLTPAGTVGDPASSSTQWDPSIVTQRGGRETAAAPVTGVTSSRVTGRGDNTDRMRREEGDIRTARSRAAGSGTEPALGNATPGATLSSTSATTPSNRLPSSSPPPPSSDLLEKSGSHSQSPSPSLRSLNSADFVILGVLGRGSSGVVYRTFYAAGVELIALKAISVVEKDKRKQLTQELRILTLIQSPYIIG